MKRGDIFFADLDPTIGSETKKKRPVLIVSNDANNKVSTTITVVPLTSNTNKVYPFEVLLEPKDSRLQKRSKAQCHQVRTIAKLRITGKKAGYANNEIMDMVDYALKIHLVLH